MEFTSLTDGLLLAARTRNHEAADRYAARLRDLLARQPETVTPLDEARYHLALAERELYRGTPEGARAALEMLQHLERDTRLGRVAVREPSFYVLRAAAFGQLYKQAKIQNDDGQKEKMVSAAMETIHLAQLARQDEWLRYLADPKRTRTQDSDDDLVELAKDRPEVRSLLGLS